VAGGINILSAANVNVSGVIGNNIIMAMLAA
jgi:hypothetical protein